MTHDNCGFGTHENYLLLMKTCKQKSHFCHERRANVVFKMRRTILMTEGGLVQVEEVSAC